MYGQKRHPKDVKTQLQEEFIQQTNNNLQDAANETPVRPGAANPHEDLDEPGIDAPRDPRADRKAVKDYPITKEEEDE
ncbi:hypothetical protein [Paraflavitalea sp. CAU 1676]|jgi:hypothetical protein|uniref:hypothetical protein n=1 Tax=Paraflavitalea sp. CAU 1676 TaxID=3032598 RepID=UPI0023DA011E|nr:hypothetical protein [Paraflavitalea sp. CAU 1676]MDF2193239.1 hypothetical protein [Paraflavitalea sp. CAU 1676]